MAQHADLWQGQLPLQGVILCCTAVPQDVRTHLAQIATEMGAVHMLDLTSGVTHLVVGSIETPKYQYVARERPDIKVLRPTWLEETRALWMDGVDVDIAALERKHHCPTFLGLDICLTGFDDLEHRTYISSMVAEQGATYHGDLTKTVTRLIAAAPEGQKYTHAKKWGITVVSLKWFEDSLRRGMALDESFYDPTLPPGEQGKGAFKQHRTSLGKRGREGDAQKTTNPDLARKRLRRTASTRLESQSQDLWQDMSAEPGTREDLNADSWRDDRSLSSEETLATSRHDSEAKSTTGKIIPKEATKMDEAIDGLFSGYSVLVHGFDPKRTLSVERVLHQNGATICRTTAELEDISNQPFFKERCLLTPHTASGKVLNLPNVPSTTLLATEWWVERCIHYKEVLDPMADPLSCPLGDAQVSGFEDLLISTTGFSGVDFRQVAETVKLMGATYQEKILPTSSVIVSGSASIKKEKAFYARKHRIPVVSADWLWACQKAKRRVPFEPYLVVLPAVDTKEFNVEHSASGAAPSDPQRLKVDTTRDCRKDDFKRLSSSRKRQITPSLALHAPKVNAPVIPPPARTVNHEDGEAPATTEASVARPPTTFIAKHSEPTPLREVSPNLSPGRGTKTDLHGAAGANRHESDLEKRSSHSISPLKVAHDHNSPSNELDSIDVDVRLSAARTHDELTADLADLLNKTGASRPSSTGPAEIPPRRKSRPLGRASSGISSRSASASASTQAQSHQTLPADGDMDSMDVTRDIIPPPSTQLGYETLESQAHRLQMSKKMGTKLSDDSDGRRVPSLGVVKDTSLLADAGVGNRVRSRGRAK